MSLSKFFDRAKVATATTGTGTMTLGAADTGFATFAEAGAQDGDIITYCIEDGNDFEVGQGIYHTSGPTLSRTTVILSKISGTAGTSKINLSGSAKVFVTVAAEDLQPRRQTLAADLNVYIATSGNDTTGDGSSGNPWATLQFAWDAICGAYEQAGHNIIINVATGTYLPANFIAVPSGEVHVIGNETTPSDVVILCDGTNDVVGNWGIIGQPQLVYVSGFTMNVTNGLNSVAGFVISGFGVSGCLLLIFGRISFETDSSGCLAVDCQEGCTLLIGQDSLDNNFFNITMSGDWYQGFSATGGSKIFFDYNAFTLSGTPNFTASFVEADLLSSIFFATGPPTGAATGIPFIATESSAIFTGTNDIAGLPGDATGVLKTGASYDTYGPRQTLLGDVTFYVDTGGSDTLGDGSVDNPWATPAHALFVVGEQLDCQGHSILIQINDGTYDIGDGLTFPPVVGPGGDIFFFGNGGDNTAVVFEFSDDSGGSSVFTGIAPCSWGIASLTVNITGLATDFAFAQQGATLLFDGIIASGAITFAAFQGGNFQFASDFFPHQYNFTGGVDFLAITAFGSVELFCFSAIDVGTSTYSGAFASIDSSSSYIDFTGFGYTGTVTAQRFSVTTNSGATGTGGNPDYFPGNTDGMIDSTSGIDGLGTNLWTIANDGALTLPTNLKLSSIPTSDPHVVGAVWNSSSTLKLSAG